jgi:hypothetical protein
VIPRKWLLLLSTVLLAACGGSSGRSPSDDARHTLAIVDQLTPPDDLVGLVGCTAHPVVLLYGLSYGFTSATISTDGQGQALSTVQLPPQFGFKVGDIAWGFLTRGATLRMRDNTGRVFYSHTYPAPPTYRQCQSRR